MAENVKETAFKIGDVFFSVLLSCVVVLSSYLLQGAMGLNLSDEGFLWYGTLQTLAGDVPVRDFQSYDPGRYYWSAAGALLFGRGIMGLRLSLAVFQVVGLSLGLLAARRVLRNRWFLVPVAVILVSWMLPRHKIFEHSLSLTAVWVGTLLLERPSDPKTHFVAGVLVGVAAFFGRNHGLYISLAFLTLIVFLWWKLDHGWREGVARLRPFLVGVLVGSIPYFAMMVLVPGLFESLVVDVLRMIQSGATNLTLVVPWPWNVSLSTGDWVASAVGLATGITFLCLPILLLVGLGIAATTRRDQIHVRALLISSTVVALCYAHHAFARADLNHLAQSSQPFLLECLALPFVFEVNKRRASILIWGLMAVLTLFAAVPSADGLRVLRYREMYELYSVGDDPIWVPRRTARLIDEVRELAGRISSPEGLLVLPSWPGLYCIVRKRSPISEIFLTTHANDVRQREIISTLIDKRVRCAVLDDLPRDGREDRRLSQTNPILWAYLTSDFERVETSELADSLHSLQAVCRDWGGERIRQ